MRKTYKIKNTHKQQQMKLPLELIQEITLYLKFLSVLKLFPKLAHLVYNKKYTWNWCATHGRLDIIYLLHKNNIKDDTLDLAMTAAACGGHLEVLKFLHYNNISTVSIYGIYWAAQRGHLEILKFLHKNKYKEIFRTSCMNIAVERGHLEIVKWLHSNRKECCTTDAMDLAAKKGHLDIFSWLYHNADNCRKYAHRSIVIYAIKYKRLNIIEWFENEKKIKIKQ